ncbi:helix-turn-helix transcriptional regulator [Microbacterium oxydans]|nr:helix-turn-helix transcriptional regulator [Microbacterium oxydans]
MARSDEQNRVARERARENILQAAIEAFSERGVAGASIAEITKRAGVAQGLVNYHFGGKEQLVAAVIDRWFETVLGFARVEGTPDEMLAAVIDGALTATAYAIPPAAGRARDAAAAGHASALRGVGGAARGGRHRGGGRGPRPVPRARGAEDPALEEVMLRSTIEGVFVKSAVFGETYPLEEARRWMFRRYGLPEPTAPIAPPAPLHDGEPRPRATAALRPDEAVPNPRL